MHTKRSQEFQLKINALIRKLAANTLSSDERQVIASVLANYTTDSPCVVKAAADEPIFVLRGQDPAAYQAVDAWGFHASRLGLHQEKIGDAAECAAEMRAYAETHSMSAVAEFPRRAYVCDFIAACGHPMTVTVSAELSLQEIGLKLGAAKHSNCDKCAETAEKTA